MTRELATAIIVALAVIVFAGMVWGWRARTRRDAGLVAPTAVPALPAGADSEEFEGFYVATTRHDAPLDRLAIRHLAFRGRVRAVVRPDGVLLDIPGEPEIFLPRADLVGAGRATWTIDRVVERDGLVLLAWRTGHTGEVTGDGTIVDSYLRFADTADAFVAAVLRLLPAAHTSTPVSPLTGSDV